MKIYVKKKRTSLYAWLIKRNKYCYHLCFDTVFDGIEHEEIFIDRNSLGIRLMSKPLYKDKKFPSEFIWWEDWADKGYALYCNY
jgi:hypothetical protein